MTSCNANVEHPTAAALSTKTRNFYSVYNSPVPVPTGTVRHVLDMTYSIDRNCCGSVLVQRKDQPWDSETACLSSS